MHLKRCLPYVAAFTLICSAANAEDSMFGYIGTYNPKGEGVYLVEMNPQTGLLTKKRIVSELPNPAQLVLNKQSTVLYVASEVANFQGGKNGSITALKVDRKTGDLKQINQVDAKGAGPVYLATTKDDSLVFVANYQSGSIAVFPTGKDGKLEAETFVFQSKGLPGSAKPEAAVEGSFAFSDHDGPHAHMINIDPSGKYAFSTDLGLDRIYQWKVDAKTRTLVANDPAYIDASSKGGGPRHFVFHANNKFFYLINEEASTITFYEISDKGTLTEKQSLSSLPKNYKGTAYASGISISPDSRFIYAVNRLHNSISVFAITEDGYLKLIQNTWTRGDYPRTIALSPNGKYLYALNQRSDNITTFEVDTQTGNLKFTDQFTAIPAPSQMVFLPN
ncbi:lactonase family protein [Microvirga sp. W0021]|uniref:Lactonase family protein n=1 Tax=Hohaiivirga grylli TaxID=3133970 RepID=A0ABV0BFG2_9HYPH